MDPAKQAIRELIDEKGTQAAAAEALGISPSFINDILHGKRNISKPVLTKLGFERVTVHVRSERVPHVMRAIEKAA